MSQPWAHFGDQLEIYVATSDRQGLLFYFHASCFYCWMYLKRLDGKEAQTALQLLKLVNIFLFTKQIVK